MIQLFALILSAASAASPAGVPGRYVESICADALAATKTETKLTGSEALAWIHFVVDGQGKNQFLRTVSEDFASPTDHIQVSIVKGPAVEARLHQLDREAVRLDEAAVTALNGQLPTGTLPVKYRDLTQHLLIAHHHGDPLIVHLRTPLETDFVAETRATGEVSVASLARAIAKNRVWNYEPHVLRPAIGVEVDYILNFNGEVTLTTVLTMRGRLD